MPGTLITGAGGFAGGRLLRRLCARGARGPVYGLRRAERADDADGVVWLTVDLEAPERVVEAIVEAAPERIHHLAAMANPRACEADPERAARVNVAGTEAVLRGAAEVGAAVLVVSTAAVYGGARGVLSEDTPAEPRNVYGRSKLAAEAAALRASSDGQRVVVARPFNHSGPGQSDEYVLPAFARGVLRERERDGVLATGNLFPERDFLHVDDVLDAYELLLERGASGGVYNVCRGRGLRLEDALRGLQRRLGAVGQRTRLDPERARPDDAPSIVGDGRRLRSLGWEPKFDVEALLDAVAEDALAAHEAPRPER